MAETSTTNLSSASTHIYLQAPAGRFTIADFINKTTGQAAVCPDIQLLCQHKCPTKVQRPWTINPATHDKHDERVSEHC